MRASSKAGPVPVSPAVVPQHSAGERDLDELYAHSPESFTVRRDAIVKRLKAAGDKEGAAAIAKRRKPTQVAFVLNQLARKHADEVAAFTDVSRALARAHRQALRGNAGTGLSEAMARQRQAVAGLTARVETLLAELALGPDGVLDQVAGALQAALVDPAAATAFEEGRLEKAPTPSGSFALADEAANDDAGARGDGIEPPRAVSKSLAETARLQRDTDRRARKQALREQRLKARAEAREQARARAAQERAKIAALVVQAKAAEKHARAAIAQAKAARMLVEREKMKMRVTRAK